MRINSVEGEGKEKKEEKKRKKKRRKKRKKEEGKKKRGCCPDIGRFLRDRGMEVSAIYYFPPRTGIPTIPSIDNFWFTHNAEHRDAPPTIELQRMPTGPSFVLPNFCRSPSPTPNFRGKEPPFGVGSLTHYNPSFSSLLTILDKYFLYEIISFCLGNRERFCSPVPRPRLSPTLRKTDAT